MYRVAERSVRSMWDESVLEPLSGTKRLTLITCWPLDEWLPGPERLVVVALPYVTADCRCGSVDDAETGCDFDCAERNAL
jgi:sortase (surface protein transpeptidase)